MIYLLTDALIKYNFGRGGFILVRGKGKRAVVLAAQKTTTKNY